MCFMALVPPRDAMASTTAYSAVVSATRLVNALPFSSSSSSCLGSSTSAIRSAPQFAFVEEGAGIAGDGIGIALDARHASLHRGFRHCCGDRRGHAEVEGVGNDVVLLQIVGRDDEIGRASCRERV